MKIIIAGAGEVGSHLAKMLSAESHEITVIDSSPRRLQDLSAIADVVTVVGSPSSMNTLKQAGAEAADLFIAVYPQEFQDVNVVSSLLAKKLGSKKVVARINSEEYLNYDNKYLFTEMGIDLMFYPEKIAADEIMDQLSRNTSHDGLDFARGKLQMAVFRLEEDSPIIDRTVKDFATEASSDNISFRIVAVSRNNETIIPKFDYKFRFHDMVYIIAKRDGIQALSEYIGTSNLEVDSVMIMGGSHTAEMVARGQAKKGNRIKIVEIDKDRCNELAFRLPDDVMIINGDGRNTDLLIDEEIHNYDAFLALTDSAETNILACVAAKKLGVHRTIAKVENLEYISLAEGMGVDAVINKKLITASRIFKFTLSDKVRFVKYMNGTNAEVIEFIVAPNAKITKAPLKDLNFPENAIIGGVIRSGESFIAVGDSQIKEYDRVAVFAMPEVVHEVDKWFR